MQLGTEYAEKNLGQNVTSVLVSKIKALNILTFQS